MEMTMQETWQPTATKADLDATIEMLRALAKGDESAEVVSQLGKVLELTAQGHDPHAIARKLNLTREDLVESIRALGKRFNARKVEVPTLTSNMLFPVEPDPDILASLSPRRRKRLEEQAAQQRITNPLPPIWEAAFSEATVRKAVAAIRQNTTPSQDLKALALRVAGSVCPPKSSYVTFPMMRATWMLIQMDQLHRLAAAEDLPVRTAQSVVAAYDTLESSRADGVAALQSLLADPKPEELDVLTVRARPLAEAAVTRLEQVLDRTRSRDDLSDFRDRGLRQFLDELSQVHLPEHVGELNEGQILRIAASLGIDPEPHIDSSFVTAEAKLIDLGLEEDIPWLKGVWIAASTGNREAGFWKAMDRLVTGDPDWTESLT